MDRTSLRTGIAAAGCAYLMWGLSPVFFKLLRHVDPLRVLAHRGLWAGVLALAIVVAFRRAAWRAWWASPARTSSLATLALSAALLASNWGVYIHAVASGQVMQSSLGYFVSPLVTVALGVALAGERPSRWQWATIALSLAAVLQLVLQSGSVPWLGLYLAASFAVYGMLRKRLELDALLASSLEALLMVPMSLGYLVLVRSEPLFLPDSQGLLLCASGVVTAVPLMLFASGAKRLSYVTLGLLQYATPSLQLVLALFAYHEPLGRAQLVAFVLIWVALATSSLEAAWRGWALHRATQPARSVTHGMVGGHVEEAASGEVREARQSETRAGEAGSASGPGGQARPRPADAPRAA
jgi:chloramphenicol-sensitive protein RarD